jgi:hypothetical protein
MAPAMFGALLLALGLMLADQAASLLAVVPLAAVGALLLLSAADLAFSRRLFDARPSCWPVTAITAMITTSVDPLWGLLAGDLAEIARGQDPILLRRARSRPTLWEFRGVLARGRLVVAAAQRWASLA